MSEHSKILEKYEKMFEDGSAYQPIKLNQAMPSVGEITGAAEEKPEIPLGDEVNKEVFTDDQHTDYTHFDSVMEDRVNAMRNGTPLNNNPNVNEQNKSYQDLEKRVALLEQALSLVMETQTKLIKESK